MKKKGTYIVLVVLSGYMVMAACAAQIEQSPSFDVQVKAQGHKKINILLALVGQLNQEVTDVAEVIKKDLGFSGQFDTTLRTYAVVSSKKELVTLFNQGYPLVIFINELAHNKGFEWRLYDTQSATMIKGRQYLKRGTSVRGWAHTIADMIWPELTSQDGFFSTKIAYCKDITDINRYKHIYVADYDGSHEQPAVANKSINLAPRFNQDIHNPLLFYSESTNANIRLMIADMKGHKKTASNFDGVNMLPSFSKDGTKLIYCASHGHGTCQLFYYEKNSLKRLTDNKGNNVSPSLSGDGSYLFFCSDYAGKPQIYCLNLATKEQTAITKSTDTCYCPAYCSKKNLLAYSKMLKGTMQLFVYDTQKATHRQITFDGGNKDECSWSPCGNYLLYGVDQGGKSRIAMHNLLTAQSHFVTGASEVCSYPTWSPIYERYPVFA